MRKRFIFSVLVLFGTTLSCAHPKGMRAANEGQLGAQKPSLRDSDEAQAAFERGQEQLKRGLTQEAIATFDDLKLTHPYSRFAALAELCSAEAYAQRQEHLTAIDGYRTFLRFHPNHPKAAYALERVGASYLAQIPKDFWPLPPAAEKDLDAIRQAISAFEELIESHPDAPSDEVQKHLAECRKKLAEHEVIVARFYHKRGRYPGALMRAKLVLEEYKDLGYDAEALYLAGSSLMAMGQDKDGLGFFEQLFKEHPDTSFAREAKRKVLRVKKTERT